MQRRRRRARDGLLRRLQKVAATPVASCALADHTSTGGAPASAISSRGTCAGGPVAIVTPAHLTAAHITSARASPALHAAAGSPSTPLAAASLGSTTLPRVPVVTTLARITLARAPPAHSAAAGGPSTSRGSTHAARAAAAHIVRLVR